MVLLVRGEGRNAAGSETMGSKQELPPKFPSALCDRGGAIAGMGSDAGHRAAAGGKDPARHSARAQDSGEPPSSIHCHQKPEQMNGWRPGAGWMETWHFPSGLERIRHGCRSSGRARFQVPVWEVVFIHVWQMWSGGCLQKVLPEEW